MKDVRGLSIWQAKVRRDGPVGFASIRCVVEDSRRERCLFLSPELRGRSRYGGREENRLKRTEESCEVCMLEAAASTLRRE